MSNSGFSVLCVAPEDNKNQKIFRFKPDKKSNLQRKKLRVQTAHCRRAGLITAWPARDRRRVRTGGNLHRRPPILDAAALHLHRSASHKAPITEHQEPWCRLFASPCIGSSALARIKTDGGLSDPRGKKNSTIRITKKLDIGIKSKGGMEEQLIAPSPFFPRVVCYDLMKNGRHDFRGRGNRMIGQ